MKRDYALKGFPALLAFLLVVLSASLLGQEPTAGNVQKIPFGREATINGVVVTLSPDSLAVRQFDGSDVVVALRPGTEFKEKKSNFFRAAKQYSKNDLVLGLNVQVKGVGDNSGKLVAEEVKFTQDDLKVAQTITSRVKPVEQDLAETRQEVKETQDRLTKSEQRADALSGKVDELSDTSRAIRREAHDAQESANRALSGVEATNNRVTALDDYEVRASAVVMFKAGKADLTDEAKQKLDEFAAQIKSEKGYLIEVAGFASSDGSEAYNRRLSEKRAQAVTRYLEDKYEVPLRRFISPFGFGENRPVADNATHEGRVQNRRAEVRLLVNRGINQSMRVTSLNQAGGEQ